MKLKRIPLTIGSQSVHMLRLRFTITGGRKVLEHT